MVEGHQVLDTPSIASDSIEIEIPTSELTMFTSKLRESYVSGYFGDIEMPAEIVIDSSRSSDSKIYFWSTDGLDVIYY